MRNRGINSIWGVTLFLLITCMQASAEDIIVYRADFPGNRIVFPTNGELFLVEGLAGNPVQLTDNLIPRFPTLSPDGSEVAFVSDLNISRMEIERRRIEPLTFNADTNLSYSDLDWSPDGRKLLFLMSDPQETQLCVMDLRDDDIRHIHEAMRPAQLQRPSWEPDSTRILFGERTEAQDIDGRVRAQLDLFVIDADGGTLRNITNTPDSPEFLPAWSPSRNRIAYLANLPPAPNPFQVYTMDIGGQNPQLVAASETNRVPLAWSRDGQKILFRSQDEGEDSGDIYVMTAQGNGIVNLTNSPAQEISASWSSDSQWMAFDARIAADEIAIFAMDANGQNRQRLTFGRGLNGAPDWSPDSDRIAFISNRTGALRIYTMDIDGQNVQSITNHQRDFDFPPAWSPDGKSIAYVSGSFEEVGLYVVDVEQLTEQMIISSPAIVSLRPAWTLDNQNLIYTEAEFTDDPFNPVSTALMMIGVNGGAPIRLSGDALMEWSYPVMSPDGKTLAFSAQRNNADIAGARVFLMDISASDSRPLQAKFPPNVGFFDMVWSPDGFHIMVSAFELERNRSVIYMVDVAAETTSVWREDAIQPDWVKPDHIFAVDARRKLMTMWSALKTRRD